MMLSVSVMNVVDVATELSLLGERERLSSWLGSGLIKVILSDLNESELGYWPWEGCAGPGALEGTTQQLPGERAEVMGMCQVGVCKLECIGCNDPAGEASRPKHWTKHPGVVWPQGSAVPCRVETNLTVSVWCSFLISNMVYIFFDVS